MANLQIVNKFAYSATITTSTLISILIKLNNGNDTIDRKKINNWLSGKINDSFYLEFANFAISYCDQRDGRGTQHYWKIQYNEKVLDKIKTYLFDWKYFYFRSRHELIFAKSLHENDISFIVNGKSITDNRAVEHDFIILSPHKIVRVEIDGEQHNKKRDYDYLTDRNLLKLNIPTIRFTAKEIIQSPDNAINTIINILNNNK